MIYLVSEKEKKLERKTLASILPDQLWCALW